ncbi:MAG TPA: LuxR C-terminal-related transcriptional regulator [Gemmatimonadaceae bacterium]|nr:LuxR C-terminal-related transcriptional regulator [Gemmatimonadaceae bacterium]
MDPMVTEGEERRLRRLLAVVLAAVLLGGTIDLVWDAPESWLSLHAIYEVLLILGTLVIAAVLWRGWWRAGRSLVRTRAALEARSAERDAWRQSAQRALDGLGQAIDQRFEEWGLTRVEREVALLLMKGRSHKAIARETGRSERTVRQHAVAIYQKSGLGGRAELAAFFLEDLMLPAAEHGGREPEPAAPAAAAESGR